MIEHVKEFRKTMIGVRTNLPTHRIASSSGAALLPIHSALPISEIYPIVSNRNDKELLDTLA